MGNVEWRAGGWPALFLIAWTSGAPAVPMRATIGVSGNMSDWTEVLTNPDNLSRDGDGSTLGCTGSTDRDCPIASGQFDLSRFAWTWDWDDFFFYLERHAAGTQDAYAYVFLDLDADGLLETSDVVLALDLPRSSSNGNIDMRSYVPADPAGDPLADPGGLADGHDMPGGLGGLLAGNTGALAGSAPGGTAWEGRVRWSRLGVDDGAAMGFHVALAQTATLPGGVTDNVGSTDGGPGSTAYEQVRMLRDRTASTAPGRTIQLPHWVENEGNVPALVSLQVRSGTGQDITLWDDTDFDLVPDRWLAFDRYGDGILTLPGDALSPEADTDGNGVLDTGSLATNDGMLLYVEETFAADAGGMTEQIDIDAWIGAPGTTLAHNRDLVRVGTVTIAADGQRSGVAGDVAWLPHVIQNNTFGLAIIDLSFVSTRGWRWEFLSDPDGDGLPADATALTDSDGSGLPDVVLQPSRSAAIFARAVVPATAFQGEQELAFVRAHLEGPPESAVTDRVIVLQALDVLPDHLAADGRARFGGAGGRIYFAHRVRNHQGVSDVLTLAASADLGWPTSFLTDPDGDGRPYDAQPMASPSVTLAPNGGELAFIVAVDVPPGTRLGEMARVDLSATTSLGAVARVEDDAIAAIVRLYAEPTHVVNVARVPSCGAAYAQASGLPPGAAGYRFAWRDPAGAAFRTLDVTTDAQGACEDAAVLSPGQEGPGWRVEIQLWDGVAWQPLDTAAFEIGDGWAIRDLAPEAPSYDLVASRFAASATFANDEFDGPVSQDVRWLVLTSDRAAWLDASGAFLPFTGAEATSRATVLLSSSEETMSMAVADVRFPGAGTYLLEAWRSSGCSGERLAASSTFEVIDDADGDGLSRDDEVAAGTDPEDDDTDDDGLTDALDGLFDMDGDGAIDALDCDSDNDGLPDGLEAGAWEPAAGTAPGSPCFVPDTWPATVTDPDMADTDGGGMPDGAEDRDGDGRMDPGEHDPLVASDDITCPSLPPDEIAGLRVTRSGAAALLTWTATPDPCATHVVFASDSLPAFVELASRVVAPSFEDPAPAGPARLRAWIVRAESWLSGIGP